MTTKFQIEHWNPNSNVKVYRPRKGVSGHAQAFPPVYRNPRTFPIVCGSLVLKKSNFRKSKDAWVRSLCFFVFPAFSENSSWPRV